MRRASISRLLRPVLLLVALLPIIVIMLVLATPVLFPVWILGLALFAAPSFREKMNVSFLGFLLFGLWWLVLLVVAAVPLIAATFAAVLYLNTPSPQALLEIGHALQREVRLQLHPDWQPLVAGLDLPEIALVTCLVAGMLGTSLMLVHAVMEIPWRTKQMRQIDTLPRSKARSAAMGLAEFEGTVRLLPARDDTGKATTAEVQPFLLEDETGLILVDPRGASVRPPGDAGTALQLNEVEAGLREGDRVYVIGNVQRRDAGSPDAAGPDRLVVRPLRQTLVGSPVGRLLFPARHKPADRDAVNIFIVDKGGERDVALRLRLALWDFCVATAVYAGTSLWLVHAAWQWLR